MKIARTAALVIVLAIDVAMAQEPLTFPQARAATYDEIRAYQALGRVIAAPDGSFFLYEWSRPYNWAPDMTWLGAQQPSTRMQTWLYRVDTSVPPETPNASVTSKYAFYQDPNSTYYLGSLSPDNRRVSFYRVNHDDSNVKAGVVTFDDPVRPTITYFEPAPDAAKLHLPSVWVSNDELVYAVKAGETRLVRASAMTAETKSCADCRADMLEKAADEEQKSAKARLARKVERPARKPGNGWRVAQNGGELPRDARILARSENDKLSVYSVDRPELLSLLFVTDDGTLRTLFENERRPRNVAAKGDQAQSSM